MDESNKTRALLVGAAEISERCDRVLVETCFTQLDFSLRLLDLAQSHLDANMRSRMAMVARSGYESALSMLMQVKQITSPGLRPQLSAHRIAVQVGHADIQHDDLWSVAGSQLQGSNNLGGQWCVHRAPHQNRRGR